MTTTETPRDADGNRLCAWCGDPIRQSGIGRSRDYCRRSCRQRAYEERQTLNRIATATTAARIPPRIQWPPPDSESSRDETRGLDTSRDETSSPQVTPEIANPALPGARKPGRRRLSRRHAGMTASAMPLWVEDGDGGRGE